MEETRHQGIWMSLGFFDFGSPGRGSLRGQLSQTHFVTVGPHNAIMLNQHYRAPTGSVGCVVGGVWEQESGEWRVMMRRRRGEVNDNKFNMDNNQRNVQSQ